MIAKKRSSNFELLRIVSMLMIVLSHCTYFGVVKVGQPDAYVLWESSSLIYKGVTSASILGTIGVGLFFMISGYFTVQKDRTSIKKVCLITLFYGALAIIITFCYECGGGQLYNSNGEMVFGLMQLLFVPITGSVWWFVTAYVALMLCAPLYNQYLGKLNKKGFMFWIFALLVFGYVLGNLGSNLHDLEKALFFYTVGAYFREYADVSRKKSLLCITILGLVINTVCSYGTLYFALDESLKATLFRKVFSMTGYLLADPLMCIGIFGLFSTISIHSGLINKMARHTFGIYLLHEAPPLRNLIWLHVLRPWRFYGSSLYFAYILFCISTVFIVGCFMDSIREKIFEKTCINMADRLIERFSRFGFKS